MPQKYRFRNQYFLEEMPYHTMPKCFQMMVAGMMVTTLMFIGIPTRVQGQNWQAVDQQLDKLFAMQDFRSASYSLVVYDTRTGERVYARNPDLLLIPASALKLLTAVAVTEKYGKQHRLKTILQAEGSVDSRGVLNGDIRIVGGGDPTLGTARSGLKAEQVISRWVQKIKQAGITTIQGNIIGDGSCFDTSEEGKEWLYEDIGNYYGGGASGLCLDENTYQLILYSPAGANQLCEVKACVPPLPGLVHTSFVRTSAEGLDDAWILGGVGQKVRRVTGTIPPGKGTYTLRGTVPDPAFMVAWRLRDALEKNGVRVQGDALSMLHKHEAVSKARGLDTLYSPKLEQILEPMLRHSQNMYAENMLCLLMDSGDRKQQAAGRMPAMIKASERPRNYLMDGSGLSPMNAVHGGVLCKAAKMWYAQQGTTGLKEQVPGVWVKSGYMERVRSYAGIVEREGKSALSFCFIVNQYQSTPPEMRRQMERVMSLLK
jgi:D-alanyl-D-alanine carboxypeptidase/D-alanyl-D-alanine-endopeptidase (penicillin-binding protein 4)